MPNIEHSTGQLTGTEEGQIKNDNVKEHVISGNQKTTKWLEPGKWAITMQPGVAYPIGFKEILAGEYIETWETDSMTRLITPLVPTFDKAFLKITAVFVPNTRVWKDAEKTHANKGEFQSGSTSGRVLTDLPKVTISGYGLPSSTTTGFYWRRSLAARYGLANWISDTTTNVLLWRGYRAWWNDFARNKEYMPALTEYNETVVTAGEYDRIRLTGGTPSDMYMCRSASLRKNYLTNIKRHMTPTTSNMQTTNIAQPVHLDWQTDYNNRKQSALNATKNDWDIIAEMGGIAPVINDRVQILGETEFEINYQQITQTSATVNAESPLGTTGSFSYTRAGGALFNHKEFKQHGYIHIIATLQIENYFEESTPKELLKTQINDIYRPALGKKEIQLILDKEISNNTSTTGIGVAYQPAWAEYNRLPSVCSGDMRSEQVFNKSGSALLPSVSQFHNMISHQQEVVIGETYFNNVKNQASVISRNNVLVQFDPETVNDYIDQFENEPILNMTEHRVKTQLPIKPEEIEKITKAWQTI